MNTASETVLKNAELLRFITAGSVDDGKSTLIGRLLHDSKSIFEDQLSAITRISQRRGSAAVDLSLLTDGLLAEREQGITIDVAYRYFATPKRKFIIGDTPGHEQYTRNMVTAASTANLAIILIDARKGVLTQSRRHAYIASLVGIKHLVVAVNKMDMVNYSQQVFDDIREQFSGFCAQLNPSDIRFVPMSALHGDMVVDRGDHLPWYRGPTLLELLESVEIVRDTNLHDFRFPVQLVCRPGALAELQDFRGYMGRIESGEIRVGDAVTLLPSGQSARIAGIATLDGPLPSAFAPQSVTLALDRHIDVSRGDMIVAKSDTPRVAGEFQAMLCWLDGQALELGRKYLVKQTTRTVKGVLAKLDYRVDINTLQQENNVAQLGMNDIARVEIKVQQPIVCDAYTHNRATGSFILIDETSNSTVAAGMVL
jgi:sulfate adenylyltransferase subunit 1